MTLIEIVNEGVRARLRILMIVGALLLFGVMEGHEIAHDAPRVPRA